MADDGRIPAIAPATIVVLLATLVVSGIGFLVVDDGTRVTRHVGGDLDRTTALWVYPAVVAGLLVVAEIGRRMNQVAVVGLVMLASIAVVVAQAIAYVQAM